MEVYGKDEKMKIGIIGLGLIGGSMAIDLKRRGFADSLTGVEADSVNAAAAQKIGLVDRVVSLEECVRECELIVLAVPVGSAVRMLPEILDMFRAEENTAGVCRKTVLDVCSTKEQLAKTVHYHPMRTHYVATHPMAGTEYSGPWAAMSGLFDGRACIICDQEESAPSSVHLAEKLYGCLNMRMIYMNSAGHDVHTAYVSHISHITSFALALTVLDKEKNEKHIFDLASGGFSSTVRLAKSNADMWVPIFSQNRENLLKVIDTYMEKMSDFRAAIDGFDEDGIRTLIEDANRIKRIIR